MVAGGRFADRAAGQEKRAQDSMLAAGVLADPGIAGARQRVNAENLLNVVANDPKRVRLGYGQANQLPAGLPFGILAAALPDQAGQALGTAEVGSGQRDRPVCDMAGAK